MSQQEPYACGGWLRCFRGIDTVTAMTLVAELHDFRRFDGPRTDGLSGVGPRASTPAGSNRAAARSPRPATATCAAADRSGLALPAPTPRQRALRSGARATRQVIAIADKRQRRLIAVPNHRLGKGCPAPKAVVAVARELVGFIWAAMRLRAQ